MIVIDANLLIYAVNEDSPGHKKAKAWLEDVIAGPESVGLPWIVLLAFLRLTTRAGLFEKPLSLPAAFELVDTWLQQDAVRVPEPTELHLKTMRELLVPLGTGGNLTSDAYLAALAIEHQAVLYSTDNDFERFRRLRWRNPLTQ